MVLKELLGKVEELSNSFIGFRKMRNLLYLQKIWEQNLTEPKETPDEKQLADLTVLFENLEEDHWIHKQNILGLLQMKPKSYEELEIEKIFSKIISTDEVLQIIAQTAVTFYCISTETRFLDESLKKGQSQIQRTLEISDSENWLSRSLEIAYVFLPHEVPLVG